MENLLTGPWGPVLVFVLRVGDVTIATLRILSAVRGRKLVASGLGFVEILVWIVVVGSVVRNLGSPLLVIMYAAGFSAGTYVGMTLEEHLAMGLAEVRIVSRRAAREVASALRSSGYGVTEFTGEGREGPVRMMTTVVPRRTVKDVLREVRRKDPNAFITVEEPRWVERGWMLSRRRK